MRRSLDDLADNIGVDGELSAATVDQNGERDARRSAKIRQFIHGRAHRAAGVEHVVHDHDVAAIEAERKAGLSYDGTWPNRLQVIAIQRDVERAPCDASTFAFVDESGYPLGQLDAAALDADKDQVIRSRKKLDHLIGHASQCASHGPRVEHNGRFSGLRALAHRGAQYRQARKGFVPPSKGSARYLESAPGEVSAPWKSAPVWKSAASRSQRTSRVFSPPS